MKGEFSSSMRHLNLDAEGSFCLDKWANSWEELCRANQQVLKIQPPQAGFEQVKTRLLRPRLSLVPRISTLWQLGCIMIGHRKCLLVDLLLEGIVCCTPRLHQGAAAKAW